MEINLIPLFIIRESRVIVIVNNKPKLHVLDSLPDNHTIIFEKNDLKVPLKLNGILAYFVTSKPTNNQVQIMMMCTY